MEDLSGEVEKLQDQVKKNSSNSGLPPSSDRFSRKKRSLRQKSGKAVGGQKGHEGKTLLQVADPDQIIVHAVECCEHCHADLQAVESITEERRQVIHLPIKRTMVTEHQTQSKCCPHCQQITQAHFPQDVRAPIQYGADLGAVAVYLVEQQLEPYERTSEILEDLLGCSMSVGTISRFIEHCAKNLEGVEEQTKEALRGAPVMHNDETSCSVAGQRWWMHSSSTKTLTHYAVHARRGQEALDAIDILPRFHGISIHDGWQTYFLYSCLHALCNVHHLRELKFQAEHKKQVWAADLINVLLDMKQAVQEPREAGQTCLAPQVREQLSAQYDAAIQAGYEANPPDPPPIVPKKGRRAQSKARNLLDRLTKHSDAVLRFLDDFAVDFDNNLAERDLRMVKVQQKVSGCFRSSHGAHAFARIRGYLSTLRKQGRNVLHALEMALVGHPLPLSLVGFLEKEEK
jgi:transposase